MAETHRLYVGGHWVEARAGGSFDDLNPFTGETRAWPSPSGWRRAWST